MTDIKARICKIEKKNSQVFNNTWRESHVKTEWNKKHVNLRSFLFKMLFYSSQYDDFLPRQTHLNKKAVFCKCK